MIDTIGTAATASSTATVCESMALYGTAPERGELDSRVVWDEDDAIVDDGLDRRLFAFLGARAFGGDVVDGFLSPMN